MIGRVRQISYLVPDLDTAMAEYATVHRIGPWFANDPLPVEHATYRGEPAELHMRIASAFSGDLEVELIEPLGRSPSVYREAIDARGFGLHHVCYHSDSLQPDVDAFSEAGYEIVEDLTVGGGFRIVYLGRVGTVGTCVELIEPTPAVTTLLDGWKGEADEWDGVHRVTRQGTVT